MGLFDRLTGTRRPEADIAPLAAADVRAALLALNGPQVPYVVSAAAPGRRNTGDEGAPEGAELVAEWRISDPGGGCEPFQQLGSQGPAAGSRARRGLDLARRGVRPALNCLASARL